MKKTHTTKMQKKVSSRRKKWTNAERFTNTQKNRKRLGKIAALQKAQELLLNAQEELMNQKQEENDSK